MIIRGNKISLNNNELEFDKNVLEAIEYQSKIIVVLASNEIDNVFCYSFDAKMLWKMDSLPADRPNKPNYKRCCYYELKLMGR